MPDIIVLIFIVISANITYMYILLDQKEGKLFVETKALENSTNGALYLVISPLLVHVVNLSVSDCQLRLKSLTKLIIFLSWLYIKHMTDRIVLIFIFWLILDFLNLKIRKFNFIEIWSRPFPSKHLHNPSQSVQVRLLLLLALFKFSYCVKVSLCTYKYTTSKNKLTCAVLLLCVRVKWNEKNKKKNIGATLSRHPFGRHHRKLPPSNVPRKLNRNYHAVFIYS